MAAQYPINFPPKSTNPCGKINVGKKIIEINAIPEKKKIEKREFLIINY